MIILDAAANAQLPDLGEGHGARKGSLPLETGDGYGYGAGIGGYCLYGTGSGASYGCTPGLGLGCGQARGQGPTRDWEV